MARQVEGVEYLARVAIRLVIRGLDPRIDPLCKGRISLDDRRVKPGDEDDKVTSIEKRSN
jgi:hypothetical protein